MVIVSPMLVLHSYQIINAQKDLLLMIMEVALAELTLKFIQNLVQLEIT
jgi:hypothetical protein